MRYLRLYGCFLRFSFSKAMEFRLDFFFRIGMDCCWYAVYLAFFDVLFRHTDVFGGWTHDELIVFQAGLFFVDAAYMTIFSSNMWWLPFAINRGDLDYHLVRPVGTLFMVSLREFAANSFVNLLLTAGFLLWALARHPVDLGLGPALLFVALLGVGILLQWALQICFLIPVFWTQSGMGLREVSFSLGRYTQQPDGILQGWVRRLFTVFLPYAVIVSFPTRALLGPDRWTPTLQLLGLCVAWMLIAVSLWRWGLRAYASASS